MTMNQSQAGKRNQNLSVNLIVSLRENQTVKRQSLVLVVNIKVIRVSPKKVKENRNLNMKQNLQNRNPICHILTNENQKKRVNTNHLYLKKKKSIAIPKVIIVSMKKTTWISIRNPRKKKRMDLKDLAPVRINPMTPIKHRAPNIKAVRIKREKLPKSGNDKMLNGINSESGASFADALGMCEPVISTSSVIKKKRPASFPSMEKSEKPKASSSYSKLDSSDDNEDNSVPDLLKKEPTPLNINIASLLPEITPHYRPLGLPIDSQPRKLLSQEDALSQAISNKNMRTKVYSGNKSHGKVDTLFDLCVRILQDNIDALEYTGGVPYIILKPVLERATPDQLFNMEHHNPYLIEDTDGLWQLHCQKEFRTKKRRNSSHGGRCICVAWMERGKIERNHCKHQAGTGQVDSVRTTKLAYVDSYVKPPRNIAKKQAKNGILVDKRPSQTPASRLAALATSGEAGKVSVPNPGSRAADRSSSSISTSTFKPKKAPLMAKTLSLLKNRFRR
ncbi:hypothetical protein NQ317_013194 [Molorchus minor]|uniref:Uncharacterized protein n=1 Tax=Molorchus minor TaxID=1323400 RepID=A0ABQ9IWL9_9CUCU|nr:hypothetical protein NQ317_013194 [Molorchus minor]